MSEKSPKMKIVIQICILGMWSDDFYRHLHGLGLQGEIIKARSPDSFYQVSKIWRRVVFIPNWCVVICCERTLSLADGVVSLHLEFLRSGLLCTVDFRGSWMPFHRW